MLWRLLGLLAGAVSQRINNATKSSCAGRGCGRAAVALVGGFSDVTFHRDGKYDAAHATDPKKPLLAAWLDVTAQSNKYHVQRPLGLRPKRIRRSSTSSRRVWAVWKSYSRRPTLCDCVCSMAWRCYAIDVTSSP